MAAARNRKSKGKAQPPPQGAAGGDALRKIARVLLPAMFFLYLLFVCLNIPLNDPDIWWHLKTGDYIVSEWEVPDVDPFAYTTPRPLTEDQKIGLRSQWLGQVIFYMSYLVGGLPGVGFFRSFLVITPMIVLYIWLLRRGAGMWTALAVTGLPAIVLALQLFYAFERPQGLSFIIVLSAIILLERARRKSASVRWDVSYWFLPAIMALWSNVHAGFIVGNTLIIIYIIAEAAVSVYRRAKGGARTTGPVFFAVCAASVLASFLNPNTYHLFYTYFGGLASMFIADVSRSLAGGDGSWVREIVLEYKPLKYFYFDLGYKWLLFYWIFTALLYLFLAAKYWLKRSIDLSELLSVTLVVVFANTYARGLMFSLTVMPLYMGKTVLELGEIDGAARGIRRLSAMATACVLALTVGFMTFSFKRSPQFFKVGITRVWVTPWYPTLLSEFIKATKIKPPMYNYYTWGGYFIWSLYPEYQVFIDGRAIDNFVNRTADEILKLHPGWKNKLDAYNINFIATPIIFRESGHIIPLPVALAYDNDWKLVFVKNNGVVFARNVPQNREIINKYNRGKEYVFLELLQVANLLLSNDPNYPVYNLSRADALLALGEVDAANAIYSRFPADVRKRMHLSYLQILRPLSFPGAGGGSTSGKPPEPGP